MVFPCERQSVVIYMYIAFYIESVGFKCGSLRGFLGKTPEFHCACTHPVVLKKLQVSSAGILTLSNWSEILLAYHMKGLKL